MLEERVWNVLFNIGTLEYNDKVTRQKVVDDLKKVLRKTDHIICDESNNPYEIIELNDLIVTVGWKNFSYKELQRTHGI